MAGAVLCHPPGPHPACRTTDTRSSGHLDRSARRVCGASSARPPRRGSDVAGFSTSERSDHNVPHYAPGFAINKYLCPTGSMLEGAPAGALDGTERRRQRPTDAAQQTAHYSGKKKAHTDKNVLLINEYTSKVIYLSPTVAGKTHDKRAVDEVHLTYPVNSTLDKDTGFQGYEPAGILTHQPKKSPE